MKNLKLSNKLIPLIIIFFFFSTQINSNEAVDIWNLNKEKKKQESITSEDLPPEDKNVISQTTIDMNSFEVLKEEDLDKNKILLVGLYDPAENDLKIDMWSKTDGKEIIRIINKINNLNLSDDSNNILEKILLTNSYFPETNITSEEFLKFKTDFLIQNNNLDLIKKYIITNKDINLDSSLINFYLDTYLSNSNLEKACEIFNDLKNFEDSYIVKFNIYCLINNEKIEEALLIYDLKKEQGFKDTLFENRFFNLIGYEEKVENKISEKNLLDFHLSHRTISDFEYKPTENTPKLIWKYLSSSNLLENIDFIDLEDNEKIKIIEKATHEENYAEKDLLELYKRFQFNLNQYMTAKDTYKSMKPFEGRALLYQRLLLTIDQNEKLELLSILKKSFSDDKISNAFNEELSLILKKIDKDKISSEYSSFYEKYHAVDDIKKTDIKFNNKIIHQSKILDYFANKITKEKTEKEINELLKKIKKNKKYIFSTEDIILLDSLKSDGIKIKDIYKKLYESNSDIPPDIQAKIQNDEIAMVLLRVVEIIGEDTLEDIGSESLNFIVNILNQLDMDQLRNKILLQVLPFKV